MTLELSKVDLFNTIKQVRAKGGAVWIDRVPVTGVPATAIGTAAARTSISTTYPIQAGAVEILAVSPGTAPTASAAADQVFTMFDIQGTSYKGQPQQLPGPITSVNLSVGAVRMTAQEWWNVRQRVVAGDQYDYGCTALIANSHNLKAWMDIMYSNVPSGLPTVYSQHTGISTFKTAAGGISTGSVTLTAAKELYEYCTSWAPEEAAVAQENQIFNTTLNCNSMTPVQTINYGVDTAAVISATSGDTQVPQISRYLGMGLRFGVPNPILNYSNNLDVTTTNNITVDHFARYTQ